MAGDSASARKMEGGLFPSIASFHTSARRADELVRVAYRIEDCPVVQPFNLIVDVFRFGTDARSSSRDRPPPAATTRRIRTRIAF